MWHHSKAIAIRGMTTSLERLVGVERNHEINAESRVFVFGGLLTRFKSIFLFETKAARTVPENLWIEGTIIIWTINIFRIMRFIVFALIVANLRPRTSILESQIAGSNGVTTSDVAKASLAGMHPGGSLSYFAVRLLRLIVSTKAFKLVLYQGCNGLSIDQCVNRSFYISQVIDDVEHTNSNSSLTHYWLIPSE